MVRSAVLLGSALVMVACSRAPRDAPLHAAVKTTADAAGIPSPDAGRPAKNRFVERLPWGRGGKPVEGCQGQDKWVGPEPLPAGTLVRFVDYHHLGSRGILVSTDGSTQKLDESGKIWSPAGHLTASQLRRLSRALSRVQLSTLFPAYFTIQVIHDQGGTSIDVPDGADVRGIDIGSACDVPELRQLIPLLWALSSPD